jgi:hypothetical protein
MVEAVYDESSKENGWRIVIEYRNSIPLRDHIIPMLHVNIPFVFYVTERLPDGKVRTSLKNMKELLLDWLDYRREVETLVLRARSKELQENYEKQQARLKAIINWPALSKLVANLSLDEDSLVARIAKQLQLKTPQAQYLLKTELGVLRRANEAEHRSLVKDTLAQLSQVQEDLKNIDRVILRELQALKPLVDDRRTKVREEEPSLIQGKGARMWAHVISDRGIVDHSAEIIKKKLRPYSHLVDATDGFSLIAKGGTVRHFTPLDDAQGDSTLRDIVGVAPIGPRAPLLFIANEDARGVALLNPHRVQAEYTAFKKNIPVVFACGFGPGDQIWIRNVRRTALRVLRPQDVVRASRGGLGKRIGLGYKDLEYLHVPKGCQVLDEFGNRVDKDNYLNKSRVFVVGPKDNYVVYATGLKRVMNIERIGEELKNGSSLAWISPI